MVSIERLKLIIEDKGYNCDELAYVLGISPELFNKKFKTGIFGSEEIEKMRIILQISNPSAIFFA